MFRRRSAAISTDALLECATITIYLVVLSIPVSAACGDYERQKLKDPPADLIPVAALQDCLQHSAVSLSSGPDAADQIATAIVVACDREIEAEAKREQATMDAPSDRIRVSLKVYVHDQALLAIVKARAEKCSLVNSH